MMKRNCAQCGADAVQNRLMVIRAGTVNTSGGTSFRATGTVDGESVSVQGRGSFGGTSQSELARALSAERHAELEELVLPIIIETMREHGISNFEVNAAGTVYRGERRLKCCYASRVGGREFGPNNQERLQGMIESLGDVKKLLVALPAIPSRIKQLIANSRKHASGTAADAGAPGLQGQSWAQIWQQATERSALVETVLAELREVVVREVAAVDKRRGVCMRCGARL